MGMKQYIIDWLEGVPGSTDDQDRRWCRLRWGLVGVAVLAKVLLWYVLYHMDVNNPPPWLSIPADWLLANVPAAQGRTNFNFSLRDQMPYIFAIGFAYSVVVAASFLFFNHRRMVVAGIIKILDEGISPKMVFGLLFGWVPMLVIVYIGLYAFSSDVTHSADKIGLSSMQETPFMVMIYWVPMYGFIGAILGQHLVFFRDVVVRALRGPDTRFTGR
ncbi:MULTISPECIES: hypothetical protein [unclassified Thioalkalivibrio]|uniref:hypothetical protein n=1 Tax=unclassified Thioalkalivibrio TaxID=2621013 RepID=UPI00037D6F92|nr:MULTISPECIES: hypothetical protein [unclassified Thioalkalivibrio]